MDTDMTLPAAPELIRTTSPPNPSSRIALVRSIERIAHLQTSVV